MTDEQCAKVEDIERELNDNYNDDILDDEVFICGIKFSVYSDSEGDEIRETLYSTDDNLEVEFERTGYKNYSYGNWVDTSWGLWR